jgi:hypothetical protein
MFRVDEFAVDNHVEHASRTLDQRGRNAQLGFELRSQTDCGGFVVSGHAEFDRNVHRAPPEITMV